MPLLSVESLSLQYRGRVLFDDDGLTIEPEDRLGIIGANGTGKSTLLKVLVGDMTPDSGRVIRAKGCRVGYLPQELGDPGDGRLLPATLALAPGRTQLEERLAELEEELRRAADDPEESLVLASELAELHADLGELDRRFAPHQAQKILLGLGFKEGDLDRPLREFSGGWRMRAALAGLLFQRPDVLLLDEPTNHLDLPSVGWLNRFLAGFRHALALICHDREFLNRHIRRVASLEVEGLRTYRGNYDQYLVQREQELELLENRVRRDEARKKELEAFVERFRAKATKARQAQSKARMIEKLEESQVEIPKPRRSVSLKFKPCARTGDVVMNGRGLGHGFAGRMLFSDLDLQVRRGDRIAIAGVNGAGKTTLMKVLAGELTPLAGQVALGQGAKLSYYAQHHTEILDPRRTVLDEVWNAAPELSQSEARGICGSFLFSGDEVEKSVGVLSGGEKARVALARILINPGNLLFMDEPTNHLDIESAEKLTTSLESYDGTLLFVSHNLDFARRLSNRVWEVGDGRVVDYPGSLGEYLDFLARRQMEAEGEAPEAAAPRASEAPADDRTLKKEARQRAREADAELRKKRSAAKKRVADIEARMGKLETENAEVEAALADPATHGDRERARTLGQRYDELRRELEKTMALWEAAEAELAALPAE